MLLRRSSSRSGQQRYTGVFAAPDQPVADVASRLAADSRDERIALADTYLQLDDETTARQLLQEVINDGGASADEARRILERIGSLQ